MPLITYKIHLKIRVPTNQTMLYKHLYLLLSVIIRYYPLLSVIIRY